MNCQPVMKWTGSKRSQAKAIVSRMPREIKTYFEPFCGGCSVLYRLLQTPSIRVGRYLASDKNKDLISVFNLIKETPAVAIEGYARLWKEFNSRGEDFEWRKRFFSEVRERYNDRHDPVDFLFVMRTTTNGMPRYNGDGDFNNSCHFSRPGIDPVSFEAVCMKWHTVIREKQVEFVCRGYDEVVAGENDFLYLDPPYASVSRHQMYFGGIDIQAFFSWLKRQKCKWLMSFDGVRGDKDYTATIPGDLHCFHEYLESGGSPFVRCLGKGGMETVRESLYSNYNTKSVKATVEQQELF